MLCNHTGMIGNTVAGFCWFGRGGREGDETGIMIPISSLLHHIVFRWLWFQFYMVKVLPN